MNAYPQIDLNNWFVLATTPGTEYDLKKTIHKIAGNLFTIYLPCRELCHRVKGEFTTVIRPLFPGYLFVHKHLETLLIKCRHSPLEGRLHPVCFNNRFARVKKHEMAAIIELAGMDGVIKASQAMVDKHSTVNIVDGPLKNFTGKIIYINRRKRKASVMVEVLNREVPITLGLEILRPKQFLPDCRGNTSAVMN